MKKILKPIFYLLLCLVSTFAKAGNYYSDPVNGSMNNNGSSSSPWGSLSQIFAAKKAFIAGDTLFLRSGNHGYTTITGTNTDYVVITPEPGQSPVISRIRVSDTSNSLPASYWKLFNLTVQSEATGSAAYPSYALIDIWPLATNITVSSCLVTSNLNTSNWTRDDWRNKCNNGIQTRPKLNSNNIIENNLIKNTAFALSVSSSNTIVRGNTIQNFTNDANRLLASDILYENNKTYDLIKVMTIKENHDDLFQAFTTPSGGEGVDTLRNVVIRNSIFVSCTDSTRAFRGSCQGIGLFDGPFYNWAIENNIVLVDHWNGIAVYGGINCKIINNTVLDPFPYTPVDPYDNNSTSIGPAWILINEKTPSIASLNNIVKNNLVHKSVTITTAKMGTATNNLIIGSITNFKTYFINTEDLTYAANFDLHLKAGCPAIDAGDNYLAPVFDYDGVTRPQGSKVDVGAYEYTTVSGLHSVSKADNDLKIIPNPFKDKLCIEYNDELKIGDQVQIYNLNGQIVYHKKNESSTSQIELDDLGSLKDGIFFLRICSSENSICQKIIKLNQ